MEQASSSTPNDLNSPDEFTISIRSIHVKTTQLLVNKSWNIGQIKASIIELEKLKNKTVRVIYHGRDLADSVLVSDAGIHAGSNVHVSVSQKPSATLSTAHQQANRGNARRGRGQPRATEDEEDVTGFDRLREMGFSAEDVQAIRLQFYVSHFRNLPPGRVQPAAQSPEMIQLENQWIDTQFNPQAHAQPQQNNAGTLANNSPQSLQTGLDLAASLVGINDQSGNSYNLLIGLIVGFLLGLISLFWISEPHLTRKTRMGMIAGVFANFCFGILAYTH